MGRAVTTKEGLLWFLVVFYLLVSLVPVGNLFIESASFDTILQNVPLWKLFMKSFWLSLCVTASATFFGVVFAILLTRSDLPLKGILLFMFLLPLLLPPFVETYALAALFGKSFYSWWGMWLAQTLLYMPIMFLGTLFLFRTIDVRLEEAALMHTSYLQVLKNITLPLLAPSLALLSIVVFFFSFGNYGVANILRYDTFVLRVFREYAAFYDFDGAFAHAVLILLLVMLFFFVEKILFSEKYNASQQFFSKRSIVLLPLGKFGYVLSSLLGTVAFFLVLQPFLQLFFHSFSLQIYHRAWLLAYASLARSFVYAAVGAAGIAFFGFLLAYAVKEFRYIRFVDTVSMMFFALPSIVIAMALTLFFNNETLEFVYTSSAMLFLGYLVKYTAIGIRNALAALKRFDRRYEEIAALFGASWFSRMRYIVFPMHKTTLAVSFFILFCFLFRESDMTMMLYPPSQESFNVLLLTLMANASDTLVAALCVLSFLSTFGVAVLLFLLEKVYHDKI